MVYALIENGIVANIIWLYSGNAAEFPNAVPLGDIPAAIGDSYDGEHFYRDGVRVLSPLEKAKKEAQTMQEEIPMLKAQVQALADRGEFLEDCIAEMAAVVYADAE